MALPAIPIILKTLAELALATGITVDLGYNIKRLVQNDSEKYGIKGQSIDDIMKSYGYYEQVSDSGSSLGWVSENVVSFADVAEAVSSSLVPRVFNPIVNIYKESDNSLSFGNAIKLLSGASMLTTAVLLDKSKVQEAIINAAGGKTSSLAVPLLTRTLENTRNQFDFTNFTIGGRIFALLSKDGRTYIPAKLINDYLSFLGRNNIINKPSAVPVNGAWGTYEEGSVEDMLERLQNTMNTLLYETVKNSLSVSFSHYNFTEEEAKNSFIWGFVRDCTTDEGVNYCYGRYYIIKRSLLEGIKLKYDSWNDETNTNISVTPKLYGVFDELHFSISGSDDDLTNVSKYNVAFSSVRDNTYSTNSNNNILLNTGSDPSSATVNANYIFSTVGLNTIFTTLDGISKREGATIFDRTKSIAENYPEWWMKRISISNPTLSDVFYKDDYLPLVIPGTIGDEYMADLSQDAIMDGVTKKEVIDTQVLPGLDWKTLRDILDKTKPATKPITKEDAIAKPIVDVADVTVPIENSGVVDLPLVPPIASAVSETGMMALYNPSKSNLREFTQWLWSSGDESFVGLVQKLTQSPMDAIIGLHAIYATPQRGSVSQIICGRVPSPVSAVVCSSQYNSVDCGSVYVNEFYNNVLDYNYTGVKIYLPFIGVCDLDPKEVMGSKLTVKYNVDFLTGDCLASISVKKGKLDSVLYIFTGNCAVKLPITGSSYNPLSEFGGLVKGGITGFVGGSLPGGVIGGVTGLLAGAQSSVQHSSTIGSNAGAMGTKKPYLIISRPVQHMPSNYYTYFGRPSYNEVQLLNCSGYTRVKEVHITNISATEEELNKIEELLSGGVII